MMETSLTPYEIPDVDSKVVIDFLESDNLDEIESGIKNIAIASDLLALVQGVAIVKIEREGYWQQAGYPNLRAYRIDQAARLGMPGSTIAQRRRIAEAWLDNHKELSRLPLSGNVAKLRFVNQAIKLHGNKKEVLKRFQTDSFRDFERYSRPEKKPELQEVTATISRGELSIDGVPVAKLEQSLDQGERDFLVSILKKAYTARKGNLVPHVVPVYDQGEARAVDSFLKKFRAKR